MPSTPKREQPKPMAAHRRLEVSSAARYRITHQAVNGTVNVQ
jgi:hypothetical protein